MKIAIIGGGIGGLCTAIALQREGIEVRVYEGKKNIKPLGAGLALSANAMKVLSYLGLSEEVIKAGKILRRLSILDEKGKILSSRDTTKLVQSFGVDNFTIHRADLHQILVRNLEPGTLMLDHICKSVTQSNYHVEVQFENGSNIFPDCLIAADGIHSVVRQKLLPESTPRYAGYTCWRGIIDNATETFDENSFSETWGARGRFGIVPLSNRRVYWYACVNAPAKDAEMAKFGAKDLLAFFKNYHFPIPQILSMANDEQLIHNDIIDLVPLKRFAFEKIVLLGDAAHATTPNMGQGACQAIEDSIFIANALKKYGNPELAFKHFEQLRIKRTTKIVNTSWSIGKLAQLDKPWLCRIRNKVLRLIPDSVNKKQLEFLYNIEFNS